MTSRRETRPEPDAPEGPFARLRDVVTDALRYWEPRRIVYNLALVAVVLGYTLRELQRIVAELGLDGVLVLFLLAVLANVCYSTVYLVDVFVQLSGFQEPWRRWRWGLLLLGTAVAGVITRFFAIASTGAIDR